MLTTLLSVLPLFGYGVFDYANSRMSKKLHPAIIAFTFVYLHLIIAFVLCLFFGLPEFTTSAFGRFLPASIAVSGGFLTTVFAFKHGSTGIVAPIANAYAVITLLISIVIYGNAVTFQQVAATLLVTACVGYLSFSKSSKKTSSEKKGAYLAVLAMVLFGIGFGFYDYAATQNWYQNSLIFEMINVPLSFVVMYFWVRKKRLVQLKTALRTKFALIGASAGALGNVGIFAALERLDSVSIPAAIAAGSPLVTAILAFYFDKERFSISKRFASVGVVIGVILLALSI